MALIGAGFPYLRHHQQIRSLSGGERSRLPAVRRPDAGQPFAAAAGRAHQPPGYGGQRRVGGNAAPVRRRRHVGHP
ncbi:hypothetical protein M8494_09935 [Serratia ureilytica]